MPIEKIIHHREKTDRIVKEYQDFKNAFAILDQSMCDLMSDYAFMLK